MSQANGEAKKLLQKLFLFFSLVSIIQLPKSSAHAALY